MSIEEIKKAVAQAYKINVSDIDGRSTKQPIATARQVVYYYVRNILGMKYQVIGKLFNRDHGAIHGGVKKIKGWKECDLETRTILEELEANHPFLKVTIQ